MDHDLGELNIETFLLTYMNNFAFKKIYFNKALTVLLLYST